MSKLGFLVTAGAFAGIGYMVGKKIAEKKDESAVFAQTTEQTTEKTTAGEKIRKASMYAVGTIRTTADKIKEGISEAANNSDKMVKRGEETVSQVKETTSGFKREIDEIKDLVTSINENEDEEFAQDVAPDFSDAAQMFEEASQESTEEL